MNIPEDMQKMGVNSLNSIDRIKKGMKTLYFDIMQLEDSGDTEKFDRDEEYYSALMKSLRYALIDNYAFIVKLEHGNSKRNTVMQLFVTDKNKLQELKKN